MESIIAVFNNLPRPGNTFNARSRGWSVYGKSVSIGNKTLASFFLNSQQLSVEVILAYLAEPPQCERGV